LPRPSPSRPRPNASSAATASLATSRGFLCRALGDLAGRRILDFGGGQGGLSVQLAQFGARVANAAE